MRNVSKKNNDAVMEHPSLSRIATDLKVLAHDAGELAVDKAKKAAAPAIEAGRRAAENVRERANHSQEMLREEFSKVTKASSERPWVAIAVASGVGFLLGAMFRNGK